ncbi:MAG: peptidoglycan DD-metalloendopeptidase family protein [Longimonas sp.]|uniref:peptidoglycan DD-metalloendopeptidase family protein n=1 Tax=Longimonas sp. TaxID=2039626 RepID=UPI00397594CB
MSESRITRWSAALLGGTCSLLLVVLTLSFIGDDDKSETSPPAVQTASLDGSSSEAASSESASMDAYGVPTTHNWDVTERTIRRNQTFADLLREHGLSYQQVVNVASTVEDIYNVRRLRTGKTLRIYKNPTTETAHYAVYTPSSERYVVYNLQNPADSNVNERTVNTEWARTSGTINGSLYQTMIDSGAHPELVIKLADVYAWQVDFFRLQPGDRFDIIYEKRSVEGERIRPGDVVAARLVHRDTPYYAFRFQEESDERAEFYDEDGNSLRREFLRAPLDYARISSRFSQNRVHPVHGVSRPHHGTDYAAPTGTPVRSVGDGVVEFAAYKGANGNYVRIRHNGTYSTGYLHLSGFADGIRQGATVKQGQTIGYVGSTGTSTGPHLDYRVWKHGTPIDALEMDLPPAYPVTPSLRQPYMQTVERLKPMLEPPTHFAAERASAAPTS